MSSKTNKAQTIWSICNACKCYIATKERETHINQCPPSTDQWSEPFILNEILFSFIDTKTKENITGLSLQDFDSLIYLSETAIQLCHLKIGDPVLISVDGHAPIVRRVWPTSEKNVTSVLLTLDAQHVAWEKLENKRVQVEAIPEGQIKSANRVVVVPKTAWKNFENVSTDIIKRLQRLAVGKVVCNGNRLSVLYYGKVLIFTIQIISEEKTDDDKIEELNRELNNLSFINNHLELFKITENTKISLPDTRKPKSRDKLKLGGLDTIYSKIWTFMETFFTHVHVKEVPTIVRSILLYGSSGTGKTTLALTIAENICNTYNAQLILIQCMQIFAHGDPKQRLKDIFKTATVPTVIVLDDIDLLCPNRLSKPSEQEKRSTACLIELLDQLPNGVFLLATSNKPDGIDPPLRRFGRIDTEMEVPVPNEIARRAIFTNILTYNKTTLSTAELLELSTLTPGYVGSDIILAYATARATTANSVTFNDLKLALKTVKPSAMREVQIESPNVHWSDIGGQETLKLKLKQAIEWPLIHPESFARMGIRPPRGVLMYGPPGCSKTMIAKALASETKLNFLSIKGPELFSKYVGESEKAVRDLFKKARQASPSVIFFDEIDAIGGERGTSSGGGGGSVQERVLAQLLTELDGVTALGAVTVIAATNRPDRIDRALLRPGRLDRIIYVPLPDVETRTAIISLKVSKMPVRNVDLEYVVRKTEGYSGAEVEAVCNEAAMNALEEDISAAVIEMKHFEHALGLITPRTSKALLDIYDNYKIS